MLRNNGLAAAKTAVAFGLPIVVSTSASKVYSGPLMPAFRAVLRCGTHRASKHELVGRRGAHAAVVATGRKTLIFAGLLTEACISFPVLSALADGYRVFVVADACGGLTATSHDLALRRLEAAGATLTSWLQMLLELQRDWTRHDT